MDFEDALDLNKIKGLDISQSFIDLWETCLNYRDLISWHLAASQRGLNLCHDRLSILHHPNLFHSCSMCSTVPEWNTPEGSRLRGEG